MGRLDVDAMLESMTSEQLSEWQVFTSRFQALPDSPRGFALLASLMSNLWSQGARRSPDEFLDLVPMPRLEQSAEDGLAALLARGATRR